MYKNIGTFYIKDNIVRSNLEFEFDFTHDKIIYEVLRVKNGQILFLEDHMTRLKQSLKKSELSCSVSIVEKSIKKLIEVNGALNKNIKIDVTATCYRVYYMESFYPNEALYQNGVTTVTATIERENPTVKRLNMDYKNQIYALKGEHFEVLLVNKKNEITEGSRANLIFIKENTLYSTPLNEILVGVTFKNVLRLAENAGFKVNYKSIKLNELDAMEACFLTGTSLGVLPIHQINDKIFNSETHNLVLKLMEAYQQEIKGEQ